MRVALIIAVLGLAAGIPLRAVSNVSGTTPNRAAVAAYGLGQAYERLFQDIDLSPGTCGIVLERARCNADLQLFHAVRPEDPTDIRVARWFESGDIALRVENWNDMYVRETAWTDDPATAWWYTAGIASLAASLPQGSAAGAYVGSIADVLAKHVSAAPDDSPKWIPSGATPFARLAAVQTSLQTVFPVEPYPQPSFGKGAVSDVQLGIYADTILQLVDNPAALSRPESRAFVAIVLARLQELHVKFSDGISSAPLERAISLPIPTDPEAINRIWRQPLSHTLNTKWPDGPRKAFLLGSMISQVAYNAAVLKAVPADTEFRGAIASLPPWRGASKKALADIAALQAIPYVAKGGKWNAINAAATRAVLDIVADH
ncbi:MAG: hypothetical protein ACYDDQ_06000 [Vulcanimicrobiaceae bacterium]